MQKIIHLSHLSSNNYLPQRRSITQFEQKRDLNDILLIEISRFEQPMSKVLLNFLIKRYGKTYFFVVDATGDGKLDGYVLSGHDETGILHIYSIAVRKEIEGKGWGKKLLMHLIEEAIKRNLKSITLEVREDNTRALKLYNILSWSMYGVEENYYNDGTNAIKMKLTLGSNY